MELNTVFSAGIIHLIIFIILCFTLHKCKEPIILLSPYEIFCTLTQLIIRPEYSQSRFFPILSIRRAGPERARPIQSNGLRVFV